MALNISIAYKNETIQILTDSKYCIGILTKNWNATKNIDLIDDIKLLFYIISKNNKVNFHWVPGHSNIEGNEMADYLANKSINENKNK